METLEFFLLSECVDILKLNFYEHNRQWPKWDVKGINWMIFIWNIRRLSYFVYDKDHTSISCEWLETGTTCFLIRMSFFLDLPFLIKGCMKIGMFTILQVMNFLLYTRSKHKKEENSIILPAMPLNLFTLYFTCLVFVDRLSFSVKRVQCSAIISNSQRHNTKNRKWNEINRCDEDFDGSRVKLNEWMKSLLFKLFPLFSSLLNHTQDTSTHISYKSEERKEESEKI